MGDKKTIRNLWELVRPVRRSLFMFLCLLVVYEGAQILESYVVSGSIRLYQNEVNYKYWLMFFAVLIVHDELFMRLDNNVDWHIITRILYPLSRWVKFGAVAKFLELDMGWHQEHNSGTLVGKVNNGVGKIEDMVNNICWEFLPTFIQTILSMVPLFFFSPFTGAIAIVTFAMFMVLSVMANKQRKPLREKRHDLYEDEWQMSTESVRSVETATMFNQQERMLKAYDGIHEKIFEVGFKEARQGIFTYNRWRNRILSWARRSCLMLWVWQLNNGTLDVVSLIYVNVLSEKLFHSFWRFARLIENFTEAAEGVNRVANLLKQKSSITDPGESVGPGKTGSPDIEFENVSFEYIAGLPILKGLSLKINPGQVVAVVGPTGSGKTTFRRLLPRLHDITEGEVRIGGTDVRRWPLDTLRSLFSYVPQGDEVYIYDDTIYYNIAFSRPDASVADVERAACLAGIHKDISDGSRFPGGYQTKVGERGIKLSGGQKQRIALARAILADRPIIILDEATNALDAVTEREIQDQLRTVFAGKTVIIIAHRLSTIWGIADKIVVLENGEKTEEGSHEELMSLQGLYAQMVGLQT